MIDEAALIDLECYLIAIATLRGPLVRNPRHYFLTTPKGKGNWVSELAEDPKSNVIKATSYDNTLLDESFVQDLLDRYGDDFSRQEIYGEIIDASTSCVFPGTMLASIKDSSIPKTGGELVFGFDIGGDGDDLSAIAVRRGNVIEALEERKTPQQSDLEAFYLEMTRKHGLPDQTFVDATGLGHFLPKVFRVVLPGGEFVSVNFGAGSIAAGYSNRRTEIYFNLRDHVKKGLHFAPHVDPAIVRKTETELFATEYKIDHNTDFALVPKKDIKKKLGRSPDRADALALACAKGSHITQDAVKAAQEKIRKRKRYPNALRR
jgi:hypothetical protein